jgi:YHS domain-containing protein
VLLPAGVDLDHQEPMSQSADPASGNQAPVIRDPVCGKGVDPLRARAVGIFGGVTCYFCSPECKAAYRDPRSAAKSAPPPAGERRLSEPGAGPDDGSGEWFARRPAPAPIPRPDSFTDLDASAVPVRAQPPSPSLVIDLKATRKRRSWLWLVLLALGGVAIVYLGLRG